MKSFNRAVEWCHGKISPDPRKWPSDMPLLRWNGWRKFTVSHSLEHVLVFGATGSGKTSGGLRIVSLAMLHAGYGVLFLTAKPEDAGEYLKWAKLAGREKSVVRFGPGHRPGFNLLEYELTRDGSFTERTMNIAGILAAAGEIVARNKTARNGDAQSWQEAAEQLLFHAINVVVLATGKVELDDVVKVARSAPETKTEAADPSWQRDSACHQKLVMAAQKHGNNRTLELADDFFRIDWAKFPDDTKHSVTFTFTKLAGLFQSDPLYRLFFSKTDFTPEILTDGAVLIVDDPVLAEGDRGKVVNGLMRLAVERMMKRRTDTNRERPVAIIWDEFQESVTQADKAFAAVARSPRCALVLATQNVNAVAGILGREDAWSLFGNCRTKLFFANDDPDTNRFMADVVGKWPTKKEAKTKGGKEPTTTTNEQDEDALPPRIALMLKSGGEEYRRLVTGVLVHGGRVVKDGKPWMEVAYHQKTPVRKWFNVLYRNTAAVGRRRPAPDFRWMR
jgi:type IV secretory pathway TraG/TraD family ATPase VirD4